ncbi:MAG TPA: hypothetical protein VKQ29_14825 [Aliidongia sp.]|nr:hypothetical protein [Aliidongia sp.]
MSIVEDFDYVVASRNGLYFVNKSAWSRFREGHFFGVTVHRGRLYCFECAESAGGLGILGRIVRFDLGDSGGAEPEILVEGLDAGCHQVDFIGDSLFVVDTHRQAVLEFDRDWRPVTAHYPIPAAAFNDWANGYVHMNSILGRDDEILLMLHKGNLGPSEVIVVDRAFQCRKQIALAGHRCHDVVVLEDGGLLYCDSTAGSLSVHGGPSIKIDTMMTRGLAVGRTEIAVGSSLFGERIGRRTLPGFVTFLDRDYNRLARLELPGAPTQIRRLDGMDLSLSTPA